MAVNLLPPPPTTNGGRAKADMIAKLCDRIDMLSQQHAATADVEDTTLTK